jgi:hypothetical protein
MSYTRLVLLLRDIRLEHELAAMNPHQRAIAERRLYEDEDETTPEPTP